MKLSPLFFGLTTAMFICLAQTAPEVKCGMLVKTNLTLAADLRCPGLPENAGALMVMDSGVTLDLNGHTVSGSGTGSGIVVLGADNVTIRNGDVRGFFAGIAVVPMGSDLVYAPVLTRLSVTENTQVGIYLASVRFGRVSDSEVSLNSSDGIAVFLDSEYNVVSRNVVATNARSGITVGCDPMTVGGKPDSSICDGKHPTENIIEDNTVVGNGWKPLAEGRSGIAVLFGERNIVRNNLIIDQNTNAPVEQNGTVGIGLWASQDNQILDNRVVNNGQGIVVTLYPPSGSSSNNVVSGNSALHNAAGGLVVWGKNNRSNTFASNYLVANGWAERTAFPLQCRSGMCVEGEDSYIMNNRAYDNVEYGISVLATSMVGFGNRAQRNGKAGQCLGMGCK